MTQENFLLWLIVLQGFFVCYFEWSVWSMNKERFTERKAWRLAKQKQKQKAAEVKDGPREQNPG
jgi:hypothetical protein